MDTAQHIGTPQRGTAIKKQRNFGEVTEYLDAHWKVQVDPSLKRMRELEKAFNYPAKQLPAILVAGTNGKSLTIEFTAKLLAHEGLSVGTFTSPHILLYKERFAIDLKSIPSKTFAEIGNEVITTVEELNIQAHSSELLTIMALLYFKRNNVDVAILELTNSNGAVDPVTIVDAKVATITRVTPVDTTLTEEQIAAAAAEMASFIKPSMHIISGDQSKLTLQTLQRVALERKGLWAMPIRKLAHLTYPFEQLHGRCAALAERIAHLFIEHHVDRKLISETNSLLLRMNGQRGRPTLESKRQAELNPRKTLEQFWKETSSDLPGKFHLLDKEKPSILLDTASNLDAFNNVLLGIRLLHYQRPHKGLAIIVGAAKNTLHNEEFLKLIRYFFKKTSGSIFICPLEDPVPGVNEEQSWNAEQVANDIKGMKVKARACKNFEEAFDLAKRSVDERYGLVAISGSHSIVTAYWRLKGIKKF